MCVGLGGIARRHITNLKALDPTISLAVWRTRSDPPGWVPPHGLPIDRYLYRSADVIAWQPDAAILANPASHHAATGAMLVQHGVHLFIEKPIDDDLSDGTVDDMIRLAAEHKRVLMVGYDLRFSPAIRAVKQALDAGRIGRPLHLRCEAGQYLPDWRPGRDYRTSVSAKASLGGGVVLELSHEIDYARWLMGEVSAISAITGRLSDLEIDVEDTADILLRFESGARGSIHLDMTDRATVRKCRIVGTEGTIACDLRTGRVDLYYGGDALKWEVLHEGLTVMPDPFVAEMRCFLACCRGDAVPPVDGATARRVLELAIECKKGGVWA